MKGIQILISIFGILFLLEKKAMNIIFNFIGLVITVSILLAQNNTDYLAYLIIIIYCSALTVIFGFVIMLTGDNNKYEKNSYLLLLIPIFVLLIYITPYFIEDLTIIEFISNNWDYYGEDISIMKKIGNLLYMDMINISKFLVSTFILFLALIALFHII